MRKILITAVINISTWTVSIAQRSDKIPFSEIGPLSLDSGTAWVERIFNNSPSDDVQVIGLGEVSHGGYEPLALKAKMIQYLVEKRGYKNILFELPDIEDIRPVRQYLLNNDIKDLSVIDSLAQTTTTGLLNMEEVFRQLFRWLKLYNLAHPREMVRIAGFDLSRDPGFQYFSLYNYIIPLDPVNAQRLLYYWKNNQASDSLKMASLNTWFNANKVKLGKALNKDDFDELQYHLSNETASTKGGFTKNITDPPDNIYRDSVMADNIIQLTGSKKTILWAHNLHISATSGYMGKYLKEQYKSRYFIFLTDFSNEANVHISAGENEVYRGNRIFREQRFAAEHTTVPYNLLKNYGIPGGIFFEQDLPVSKVYDTLNVIDMVGKQFRMIAAHTFDVLMIFNNINPYPKPVNNR